MKLIYILIIAMNTNLLSQEILWETDYGFDYKSIEYLEDSGELILGSYRKVSVVDANTLELKNSIDFLGDILAIQVSPDNQFLAILTDRDFFVTESQNLENIIFQTSIEETPFEDNLALNWDIDSKRILYLSKYRELSCFDIDKGKEILGQALSLDQAILSALWGDAKNNIIFAHHNSIIRYDIENEYFIDTLVKSDKEFSAFGGLNKTQIGIFEDDICIIKDGKTTSFEPENEFDAQINKIIFSDDEDEFYFVSHENKSFGKYNIQENKLKSTIEFDYDILEFDFKNNRLYAGDAGSLSARDLNSDELINIKYYDNGAMPLVEDDGKLWYLTSPMLLRSRLKQTGELIDEVDIPEKAYISDFIYVPKYDKSIVYSLSGVSIFEDTELVNSIETDQLNFEGIANQTYGSLELSNDQSKFTLKSIIEPVLYVFSVNELDTLLEIETPCSSEFSSIIWGSNDEIIFGSCSNYDDDYPKILGFDVTSGDILFEVDVDTYESCLAFNKSKSKFIYSSNKNELSVFDLTTEKVSVIYQGEFERMTNLDWVFDERYIIYTDMNGLFLIDLMDLEPSLTKLEISSFGRGSGAYFNDETNTLYFGRSHLDLKNNLVAVNLNTILDIDELIDIDEITVYPNPTNDKLFLDLQDLEAVNSIEIYDISGEMVLSLENISNGFIDVSALASGIYYLKTSNSEGLLTKVFVKE